MAENDTSQEKTEQPTEKRLRETREKGEVARSRELNTVVGLLTMGLGLVMFGGDLNANLMNLMQASLTFDAVTITTTDSVTETMAVLAIQVMWMLAPLFSLLLLSTLFGPAVMGGLIFRLQAIAPKPEKLNPIKGLGRIFSSNGLMELLKALGKFLLVAVAAFFFLKASIPELMSLGFEPLQSALAHSATLMTWCLFLLGSVLIVVAAVDVPFQLWQFNQKLKMTRQEVKDEMKETDGRPEVKQRIRQLRAEIAQRQMIEDVKTADVVVRNPTHFAVALKYADAEMGAPRVVAKGKDLVALALIEAAEGAGVPVVSAPPLARALFAVTEVHDEIPEKLYLAVAQLLAFVYQLNDEYASTDVPDIEVPADLEQETDFGPG